MRTSTLATTISILLLGHLPAHAQNLVGNGSFDAGIASWMIFSPPNITMAFDPQDALGSPTSGSAYVTNQHPTSGYNAGVVWCAKGLTGSASYDFGAKLRVPSGQSGPGDASVSLTWFDDASCAGTQTYVTQTFAVATSDEWTARTRSGLTSLAGTKSAWVYLSVYKTSGGGVYGVYWDDVFLERTPAVVLGCTAGGAPILDTLDRGFYVPAYSGGNVRKVTLWISAPTNGFYTLSLTARAGSFDGPILGSTLATARVTATPAPAETDFYFPGAALRVAAGSTVVFTLAKVNGPAGALTFDASSQGACNVVETEDTAPPLSTVRRNGMRVTISGDAATLFGDLDQNAIRDIFDVVTMAGSIVGNVQQGVAPFTAPGHLADLNRDGIVDIFDLLLLQALIVGNVLQVPV